MNGKITFSIIFATIISFGLFLIVESQNPDYRTIKEHEFYSQDVDSDNKLIFLLGSSHVGQLNSTLIHENISQKFSNHITYNLSYFSDTPSERIQYLENIIKFNPELVVYGISYREFQIKPIEKQPLPDPKQFLNDFLINQINLIGLDDETNPKFTTLEIIRKIFFQTNLFPPRETIRLNYTPFLEFYQPQMIIQDEAKLNRQILEGVFQIKEMDTIDSIIDYKQISNLRSIIENLQENKIKIVILITPLHQPGFEQIPLEAKEHFSDMIKEIKNTYDVKIYNFSNKYANQNIWSDIEHVSFNKKSKIYSEDVIDIIKSELEK